MGRVQVPKTRVRKLAQVLVQIPGGPGSRCHMRSAVRLVAKSLPDEAVELRLAPDGRRLGMLREGAERYSAMR